MPRPTAVSTDVALMGLTRRLGLAVEIIAATEENTPLHRFAEQLRAHCAIVIAHLEKGSEPGLEAAEIGIAGLIATHRDSASFIILADLAGLLSGSRLPERGSHV
jgi:hypothetical protein